MLTSRYYTRFNLDQPRRTTEDTPPKFEPSTFNIKVYNAILPLQTPPWFMLTFLMLTYYYKDYTRVPMVSTSSLPNRHFWTQWQT
jgi:hypothetical protein